MNMSRCYSGQVMTYGGQLLGLTLYRVLSKYPVYTAHCKLCTVYNVQCTVYKLELMAYIVSIQWIGVYIVYRGYMVQWGILWCVGEFMGVLEYVGVFRGIV